MENGCASITAISTNTESSFCFLDTAKISAYKENKHRANFQNAGFELLTFGS